MGISISLCFGRGWASIMSVSLCVGVWVGRILRGVGEYRASRRKH